MGSGLLIHSCLNYSDPEMKKIFPEEMDEREKIVLSEAQLAKIGTTSVSVLTHTHTLALPLSGEVLILMCRSI